MRLKKLYDPKNEIMRVAGFISGGGSNLVKIIEHEKKMETEEGRIPYQVVVIFSEDSKSNANRIGEKFGIPAIVRDMSKFYLENGKPKKDLGVRREFDAETVSLLRLYEVDVVAYAGYMSIVTDRLIEVFLGVNVHPADLSIMNGDKRKYTGAHAVRDAIFAGEKQLRATTHIVESKVDYGRILMISQSVIVNPNLNPDENQSKLKESGDWIIFPRTLECIANGRYSRDEKGNLFLDDGPIPFGLKLDP